MLWRITRLSDDRERKMRVMEFSGDDVKSYGIWWNSKNEEIDKVMMGKNANTPPNIPHAANTANGNQPLKTTTNGANIAPICDAWVEQPSETLLTTVGNSSAM
ncbi:hypothetical protein Lal_00003068 [Lupinus albus]|nr:hypothetical protein Lal_00003068 [Lupinus albus]